MAVTNNAWQNEKDEAKCKTLWTEKLYGIQDH
jgi:hypothetical protein